MDTGRPKTRRLTQIPLFSRPASGSFCHFFIGAQVPLGGASRPEKRRSCATRSIFDNRINQLQPRTTHIPPPGGCATRALPPRQPRAPANHTGPRCSDPPLGWGQRSFPSDAPFSKVRHSIKVLPLNQAHAVEKHHPTPHAKCVTVPPAASGTFAGDLHRDKVYVHAPGQKNGSPGCWLVSAPSSLKPCGQPEAHSLMKKPPP